MKLKISLLMVVLMLALNGFAADDWANLSRYVKSNKEIMARSDKNDHLVVFLGNSITDGWPNSNKAFFEDNNFVGRGISGQTTYQFLVRFYSDVVNLQPEAVVINGGINDIAENNYEYDETRTFNNLKAMAEIADANGIKVILTSVLPSDRFGWRPLKTEIAPKVMSLNKRIKALAKEKGYAYVDYFSPMEDSTTHGMKDEYTNDGVHPTDNGYRKMEEIVLPVIRSVVKR
ncbi:MAG: SGNH/GDSL hydrolase family protein [Bacteroidales bacterium]|nr:SGNH/GDSL hydrolase family protein [Bacteroidales bacterium]